MKTGLLLWQEIRKHTLLSSKACYILSRCYFVGPSNSSCIWANRKNPFRVYRLAISRDKESGSGQGIRLKPLTMSAPSHVPFPPSTPAHGAPRLWDGGVSHHAPALCWVWQGHVIHWPGPGDRSSSLPGNRGSSGTLGYLQHWLFPSPRTSDPNSATPDARHQHKGFNHLASSSLGTWLQTCHEVNASWGAPRTKLAQDITPLPFLSLPPTCMLHLRGDSWS